MAHEFRFPRSADCPDAATHTPQPGGYQAWRDWANHMADTRVQTRCSTCGFWVIWVPRETPAVTR